MNSILQKHGGVRGIIRQSFVDILHFKHFRDITVMDIAVKGGVAPREVTRYYETTDALLREIAFDLADGLITLMHEATEEDLDTLLDKLCGSYHPGFLAYFTHARANSETFSVLVDPRFGEELKNLFLARVMVYRIQSLEKWRGLNGSGDNKTLEALYTKNMDDFLAALLNWARQGMVVDDLRMAEAQSRVWVANMLTFADPAPDSIHQRLLHKISEKGVVLPDIG